MRKNSKKTLDKFKIDLNGFKIVNKIKAGSFGCVYTVLDKKSFEQYAAKVLFSDEDEEKYQKLINREVGIMMRVQHPTFIKLIGYSLTDFDNQNNVTILMELATRGSLADIIKKPKDYQASVNYDNTARQIILVGVARGMMYLHQHNVIHRDLKPDNVLLDNDLRPHITDFGLSKFFKTGNSKIQSQACGTPVYKAPEIIASNTQYDTKADVYAYGILMFEVLTQLPPYPLYANGQLTEYQLNEKVVNEDYRPEFTVPIKESHKQLIEQCLAKDPTQRPTFEVIFNKLGFNHDIKASFNLFRQFTDADDYYLDDIDIDELLSYIDEINENDAFTNDLSKKVIQNIRQQLVHQEKTFKSIIQSIITIDGFNNITLESQQLIISEIMQDSPNDPFLSKINNFLIYLLNFDRSSNTSNGFNFVSIPTNTVEERLLSIKDGIRNLNRIHVLSNATELLYQNKSLNSQEFINLLNTFQDISIELSYPSEYFEPVYDIVTSLKKRQLPKIKTTILISGIIQTDETFKNNQNINSVKIDFYVQQIGPRSFHKCSSLTSVNIPSSIISIGEESFKECTSLADISIPSSVNSLCDSSFANCSSIRSITIPSSITSIGKQTFSDCASLIQIALPISVTKIPDSCFAGCSSLTQIIIPNSVTFIGCHAFSGCASLAQITIPYSVTYIGNSAFLNCTSLMQITIPSSIKSIEDSTFLGCTTLTQVTIPSSVSSIGEGAFLNCYLLIDIVIPCSVTIIKNRTFRKCMTLRRLTIPDSITSIGSFSFAGCASLSHIIIPSSVKSIGDNAFDGCSSLLDISIPSSVTSIGNFIFYGCTLLTDISIPPSITTIGNHVFTGCTSLTNLSIPSSITSIGNYAFSGCTSLLQFKIPNHVVSIGHYAFQGCSSLKQVEIPSSVTTIGDWAFQGCVSLTEINIPSSVINVGENAFKDLKILKDIEF